MERRTAIAGLVGIVAVSLVVIALLPGSAFLKGLSVGCLVSTAAAVLLWAAWVPSGLASRSMGGIAEDWTSEELRRSPAVWVAIPSLKYAGKDVDHLAICRGGLVVIETKWTAYLPSAEAIDAYAYQAADAARTARLDLSRPGLRDELWCTAVVLWGPAAKGLGSRRVSTAKGPVTVLSGYDLFEWLERLCAGPIGADYAEDLGSEIHALALERDRQNVHAGRTLRWLARTR